MNFIQVLLDSLDRTKRFFYISLSCLIFKDRNCGRIYKSVECVFKSLNLLVRRGYTNFLLRIQIKGNLSKSCSRSQILLFSCLVILCGHN